MAQSVARVSDGVCHPINPTLMKDWVETSGLIVYPHEYAILRAIDRAYCAEMNKEFSDYRARREEEAKQKAKK